MHTNYRHNLIYRIVSRGQPADNGCLEYNGGECAHKYGLVSVTISGKRKVLPAHRALWIATNDCFNLPRNVFVRHTCDNPCCVNIDHLIAGTPKDNVQDCIKRKRRATKYKPHTRLRALSDDQIRAIRNASGKQCDIARQYNVSASYVCKLRLGQAKPLIK